MNEKLAAGGPSERSFGLEDVWIRSFASSLLGSWFFRGAAGAICMMVGLPASSEIPQYVPIHASLQKPPVSSAALVDQKSTSDTPVNPSTGLTKLLPVPIGVGQFEGAFGSSIALSGSRMLVGGTGLANSGAAVIFEQGPDGWIETAALLRSDPPNHGRFGANVALSGDWAAVSASGDDDLGVEAGAVYVFRFDGSGWFEAEKLLASDGEAWDSFGTSIALDGDRLVVGARGDDDRGNLSGAVYVFEFDGVRWVETEKLSPLEGGAGDAFGVSVDLDGERLLVGAAGWQVGGVITGGAFVFENDSGQWLERDRLEASDGEFLDDFGLSVALSGDRALIGSRSGDGQAVDVGAAYVFDFDGLSWEESIKLVASDADSGDAFGPLGPRVVLDGNQALIGAPGDSDAGSRSGAAYLFEFSGSDWDAGTRLHPDAPAREDEFGSAVALHDGLALVGAPGDDEQVSNTGSVFVFETQSGARTQTARVNAILGPAYDYFGSSVSLSAEWALVGARSDYDGGVRSGAAYFYDLRGREPLRFFKVAPSSLTANDSFGTSVVLSQQRALITATGDDENGLGAGAAYVYVFDGFSWQEEAKLTAIDGVQLDRFGDSVDLWNDRALIGATGVDVNGTRTGAAYIFDFDGQSWSQTAQLTASDGASPGSIGEAVSLFGDRAVVGRSRSEFVTDLRPGTVHVFEFNGSAWIESHILQASDSSPGDNFGVSVGLSGDRLLVGAQGRDDNGNFSGAAYVFEFDGSDWVESVKLLASDGRPQDAFGRAVSLDGDRALISAPGDNGPSGGGLDAGAAYVFELIDDSWVEVVKLSPADRDSGQVGNSLSISGNLALVGAHLDKERGVNAGAAYLFEPGLLFRDTFEASVEPREQD